jgi:hypothetical protein
MQDFFKKLFEQHSSGASQTQREALVDLCLLGMYSDTLVSLAEQDFLNDEYMQLQWESRVSFDIYLQTTTAKVRSVKNDPLKMKELIQDIDRRLGNDEFRRRAMSELEQLLSTDGVVNLEQDFLAQVKAAMGI